MPKTKRFTARKHRSGPLSANPETARVREIEQSRVGWPAEQARIGTKYRTRLARAKYKLHHSFGWKSLSNSEQIRKELELKENIMKEKDDELQNAAKEWVELTQKPEPQDLDIWNSESDSEESWQGIPETNEDNKEENDSSDAEFEDGDVDAPEDEELFDEQGNKMSMEDISKGMHKIFERHMTNLRQSMRKYEAIAEEDDG